jgi:parallel beta-helix repeat protein
MRTSIQLFAAVLALIPVTSAQFTPGARAPSTTVTSTEVRSVPVVIDVPSDHPTIQAAIDAAHVGDVVRVWAGTYTETIDFKGKAIRVEGKDGASATTIDGDQAGSVVTFGSGEGRNSVLVGFTITGGLATEAGGGVLCRNGSSPTIRLNTITGNATANDVRGGGVACLDGSEPLIEGNLISSNTGDQTGGGIYLEGSDAEIVDNTISANQTDGSGGGLHADSGSSARIEGNTISSNNASSTGGGALASGVDIVFADNVFDQNTAHITGGLYLSGTSSQSRVTGNAFTSNSCNGRGGGMYAHTSEALIDGNAFFGNSAGERAGGLACYSGDPVVTNNLFQGNSATLDGGAMHTLFTSLLVRDNVFAFNVAGDDGGAVELGDGEPLFVNNVVHDNQAGDLGGGLSCNGADATITNCTFSRNTADGGGGGLCQWGGAFASVSNSIFWDDEAPLGTEIYTGGAPIDVDRCDVEFGWPGLNIALPPAFADPDNGDYHLTSPSPCIDSGDNFAPGLPAKDIEGDARILDGDLVPGAVVDMGADEYGG